MTGSAGSRSVSPSSHDEQSVDHVSDHVTMTTGIDHVSDHVSDHLVPPTQFWFDDYSLISSSDSRSRTSTSPKVHILGDLLCSHHHVFRS